MLPIRRRYESGPPINNPKSRKDRLLPKDRWSLRKELETSLFANLSRPGDLGK